MSARSGDGTDGLAASEPVASARPERSRRARLVRRGFLLVVVVALAALLWRQQDDVVRSLQTVSPLVLLGSLAAGLIGVGLPAIVWRDLLVAQGYRVGPVDVARVFFLAQMGKYVPGGIWALVAQVDLARDLRIPARPATTATLLTIALSILAGSIAAAFTLPVAVPDLVAGYWWIFLLLPVLLVLLHPRMVEWWTVALFRLIRRPVPPFRLSWAVTLRAVLLLLASWAAFGVHFALLVQGVGETGSSLWLLSTGVFALAWIAGFLVVVAPAGAGVREGALVLGFAALLPPGAVLTLALVSRVVLIVADVVLAAAATAVARMRRAPGSAASAASPD